MQVREYNKIDERVIRGNVIGNEKYVVEINQNGDGVSKFGDIYINRFKKTDDYKQGIFVYVKDIKTEDKEENIEDEELEIKRIERLYKNSKGEEINE